MRVIGLGAVALIIGLALMQRSPDTSEETVAYTSKEFGVQLTYPAEYVPSVLDEQSLASGMFFRAEGPNGAGLISLRREEGLGVLRLSGDVLDTLVSTATARYETQFPEYHKEHYEERVIAKNPGAVLEFTYLGADGMTRVWQRMLFIVVNNERAYFLTFQTPEGQLVRSRPMFELVESSFEVLPSQSG